MSKKEIAVTKTKQINDLVVKDVKIAALMVELAAVKSKQT